MSKIHRPSPLVDQMQRRWEKNFSCFACSIRDTWDLIFAVGSALGEEYSTTTALQLWVLSLAADQAPGKRAGFWHGAAPFGHPGRCCLLRAGSLFCRDVLRGSMVVFPSLCFPQSFSCSPTPKSHPCSLLKTHSTLQPQCHLPVSRLSTFVPDSSHWAPSPSSFTFQPCLLT